MTNHDTQTVQIALHCAERIGALRRRQMTEPQSNLCLARQIQQLEIRIHVLLHGKSLSSAMV